MKTLYLIRHAKSSWDHEGLTDFERPLNKRGEGDAPLMGGVLRGHGARPELIRSSAALRAITTAEQLAEVLSFPLDKIVVDEGMYGAAANDLLKIVRSFPDTVQEAMLVGHNPTMHILAERIAAFDEDNLPTCGAICIDFMVETWQEVSDTVGKIRYYEYPKKHM